MGALDYELIYMSRKTVSISVNPDGSVTVKAPKGTKKAFVDALVKRHMMWIENKRCQIAQQAQKAAFDFSDGLTLTLLGKEKTIATGEENEIHCDDKNIYFPPSDENTRREMYREYLKQFAAEYLKGRTDYFSKVMNAKPSKIGITFAKTRWGSCSAKNSINFSAYVMSLEPECIDLTVVHELSHIYVKNHSKAFYAVVDRYINNRKELEKRMKAVGRDAFRWDK